MPQTQPNGATAAPNIDPQATFDAARHAAEHLTGELNRWVSEFAAEAGEAVRDAVRKASASAHEFGDEAIERGKTYSQDVRQAVTKQPVAALLIVGAAAFLTGLLVARR